MKPVISNTKRTWLRRALASRMKSTFVVPAVGAGIMLGAAVLPARATDYVVVGSGGNNTTTFNTLEGAIMASNASGTGNTISFAPTALSGGVYSQTGDLPPITSSVAINGGGVTINANGNRAFMVGDGTNLINVSFNNLTIEGAEAKGGDGGDGVEGGGGGAGLGGAVFVNSNAAVTLNSVSFTENKAQGGSGGAPESTYGGGGGGGLNGGDGGDCGGGGGGGGAMAGGSGGGSQYGGGGGGGVDGDGNYGPSAGGAGGGPNGGSGGANINSSGGTVTGNAGGSSVSGGGGGGGYTIVDADGNSPGANIGSGGNGGDSTYGGGGGGGHSYIGNNGNSNDKGYGGTGGNSFYGGGGGGGQGQVNGSGQSSGGNGGNSTYGGGGGGGGTGANGVGSGGTGGFAGGGGGNGGNGGFGGGTGSDNTGGGGAGFGGAVFVRSGGSLTIEGSTDINGNNVNFGTGGNNGQTAGSGIFLNGESLNFNIGSGESTSITDNITDGYYEAGHEGDPAYYHISTNDVANTIEVKGSITKTGDGTLNLLGNNTISGTTSADAGLMNITDGTYAGGLSASGTSSINIGDPLITGDGPNAAGSNPAITHTVNVGEAGNAAAGVSNSGSGTFSVGGGNIGTSGADANGNVVTTTLNYAGDGDYAVENTGSGNVEVGHDAIYGNGNQVTNNVTGGGISQTGTGSTIIGGADIDGDNNQVTNNVGDITATNGEVHAEFNTLHSSGNVSLTNLGHQSITGPAEGHYGDTDVYLAPFSDNNSDTINIDGIEADDATVNIGGGRHEVHGDGNDYQVVINHQNSDPAISLTNGATATLSGGTNEFYGANDLGGNSFTNTVNGDVSVTGSTLNLDAGSISADSFQDQGNQTGNTITGDVTLTNSSTLNLTGQTTSVDNTGNNISSNSIGGTLSAAAGSDIYVVGHNNTITGGVVIDSNSALEIHNPNINILSGQNLENSISGNVTLNGGNIGIGLSSLINTGNNNTVTNTIHGTITANSGEIDEITVSGIAGLGNTFNTELNQDFTLTNTTLIQQGAMTASGANVSGNTINNSLTGTTTVNSGAILAQRGSSIIPDDATTTNNQINNIITGDVTVDGGTLQQQGGYISGYNNSGNGGSSSGYSATDNNGNAVTNIIHGHVTVLGNSNFLIDGERNIVTNGVTTMGVIPLGTHIGGGNVSDGGATIHNESTADHTVSAGGHLHIGTNPNPGGGPAQTITGSSNTILNRVIGDSGLGIEGSITVTGTGSVLGLGDGFSDSGALDITGSGNTITNEVSSTYTADGNPQLQTVTGGGEILLGGRDITSTGGLNSVYNIVNQDVTLGTDASDSGILELAGTGAGSTTGANAATVSNIVTGAVEANGTSFVQFSGANNTDASNTIAGSVTVHDNSLLIAQDGAGDTASSGNKVTGGIYLDGTGYTASILSVPLGVVVGSNTGGNGITQNNSLQSDIHFTGTGSGSHAGVGIGAVINNSGGAGANTITNTHIGVIDTADAAESGDVILEGIVTAGGGTGSTTITNNQVGNVTLTDGDVTMTGSIVPGQTATVANTIYGSVILNNTGALTLASNLNGPDPTQISNLITQGAYLNGASDGLVTGAHNEIDNGVFLNTDTDTYDHGGEDEHNDITTLTIGGGTDAGSDVTNSLLTSQVTINANPYSSEQRAVDHGYDTDSGHLLVGAYGASNTTNGHNITNELTGNVLLNAGFANDVNDTGTGDGSYTGGMVIVGGADNDTTDGGTVTNEINGTVTLHGGSRLHLGGGGFDNATGGAVNNTITGAVTADQNSFIAMWGEQDANNRLHNTIGSDVTDSSYGLTLSGNALFHAEGMDDTVGGLGTELNGSSTAQFAGGAFNNRLINNMHGGYTLNNSSTLQIGDRSIFTDGSALVQTNTIDSNGTNGNVVLNDSSLLKVLSGGAGGTHSAVGSNAIADNLTLNGNEGSTSFLTTIGTQGDPTPATPNSVATGVAVGGMAALNGAQVKVLSTDDQFTFGRRYTLVQAIGAGSVTSGFAAQGELTDENGNVLTQPAALDLATGWNSSSAWLDFLTDFHDVANTTNQQHFGQYLDDLVADSGPDGIAPGSNLSTELNYLVSQDNPNAYNDFMGDSYSAFDTVGYWNTNNFVNSIATHARQSHDNDWTESFALNAQNGLSGVGAQMSLVSQLLNSRPTMALNANGNNGNSNSALWGEIGGHWLRNDGDSSLGSPDWSQNSKSVNIGYQGGGDSFSWGITGGYHDGDIDFNNRAASGDNDGWNLGLNGLWKSKSNVYVNGVLSYGHESDSLHRNDGLGDTNSSDFNAKSYAAMLEIGKRIDKKTYNFTPYASLLGVKYDRDGADEGSGVGALSVDSESHNYLTSTLGIRIGRDYLDKTGAKRGGVMLGVSWQHQFSSTDFPVTASINGAGGSFTTYGTPLSGDSLGIQLGAYGRLSRNLYGFLNYSGNFGGNQKINSITAGLQYGF